MNRSFVLLVVAAGGAWLIWRRRQPASLAVKSATAKPVSPDAVARLQLTPPTQNTVPPGQLSSLPLTQLPKEPGRYAGLFHLGALMRS